jgi:hypothetical protein
MWIEKLAEGVLQVDTPIGPRFIQPGLLERALLLWTFRNFTSLPQPVLSMREQQLVNRLCSEQRFVPMADAAGKDKPLIGRIENRSPIQPELAEGRRPVAIRKSGLPERGNEAASA